MSDRQGQLLENQFLRRLVADFPRHPKQLNAFLESDAELLPLSDQIILSLTTDSIVEEIKTRLYEDPYLIGWMTVMVNLSDLAAVGARPIGLILSQHLPDDLSSDFLTALQRGINDACRISNTYVLGGDTNTSESLQMGATAVGIIEDDKLIKRSGAGIGDKLFASSTFGLGNAYAFSRFFGAELDLSLPYQPQARLAEGSMVRQFGSACIDTSDGFFPALANLMGINKKGFVIEHQANFLVSDQLLEFADHARIPAWFFLAGPHGEYELLFTIPVDQEAAFLQSAKAINWQPVSLGKVIEEPKLYFFNKKKKDEVDPFRIANLFNESESNPKDYLQKLLETDFYER